MNDLLDVPDLEFRIATTATVRAQLEAARMIGDRADVTNLQDERRLRALVEELITLRGLQIDGLLPAQSRKQA